MKYTEPSLLIPVQKLAFFSLAKSLASVWISWESITGRLASNSPQRFLEKSFFNALFSKRKCFASYVKMRLFNHCNLLPNFAIQFTITYIIHLLVLLHLKKTQLYCFSEINLQAMMVILQIDRIELYYMASFQDALVPLINL